MVDNYSMPVTGGFFSTNGLIVLGVAVVFIILYIIFVLLRENKNDELKEFVKDDFVDDDK